MRIRGVLSLGIPRNALRLMALGMATLAVAASPQTPAIAQEARQPSLTKAIQKQADGRIKKFYQARGFKPLWVRAGKIGGEVTAFLEIIDSARLDGLDPDDYDSDKLRAILAEARSGEPDKLARAELFLSELFARFVDDMRQPGMVEMRWLDPSLKPQRRKADAVLRAATFAPSFPDYVVQMGWMNPQYARIRKLSMRAASNPAPPEVRARLALNLDRARLLPSAMTQHIVVDAASGRLWYYQSGKEQGAMRVVVGKAKSPTPMLAGMMQYAILNPYWNVPEDLTQTLIAPKVVAGRSLSSMGMEALSDYSANPAKLNPKAINWRAVAAGAETVRVRQLPGKSNSMGRAKFMFPNDQGIYLHDTPERNLFTKSNRHFSNGCVRLEDAAGLGQWLLGRSITAPGKGPEQAVPLKIPVPVYLTYLTATESKAGVVFLTDVYGRDRAAEF
jgi:L,D-transpeptidase YcbB